MIRSTQAIVRIGHERNGDSAGEPQTSGAVFRSYFFFVLPDYWLLKNEVINDPSRVERLEDGKLRFLRGIDPFNDTVARAHIPLGRLGGDLDHVLSYLVEAGIAAECQPLAVSGRTSGASWLICKWPSSCGGGTRRCLSRLRRFRHGVSVSHYLDRSAARSPADAGGLWSGSCPDADPCPHPAQGRPGRRRPRLARRRHRRGAGGQPRHRRAGPPAVRRAGAGAPPWSASARIGSTTAPSTGRQRPT